MSDYDSSSVIVAIPGPNHAPGADIDKHITLCYLGDSLLPDDAAAAYAMLLQQLWNGVGPFEVPVLGTDFLGEDKEYHVVLLGPEELTKIRAAIMQMPGIADLVAASEPWPEYLPHMTLGNTEEGYLPVPVDIESLEIVGLGIWNGSDRLNTLPSPLSAAAGQWTESLHPRGKDGKFIRKFGIVKFLGLGGWKYGKVVGMTDDPKKGVQITVRPSSLSGVETGEADVDLTPKKIYSAPTPRATLLTAADMTKTGGQAGSNPGGFYAAEDGKKFYVKKAKSAEHGKNEALANALYEEAGVRVPEVSFNKETGEIFSAIVEGSKSDASSHINSQDADWLEKVHDDFVVDAWLANWDVFGATNDNMMTADDGTPVRIDSGGALLFRAQGTPKGTAFGSKVGELETLKSKRPKVYKTMSAVAEIDGAKRVLAISPERIEELVAESGLPKSLADTLKARRAYIASYYSLPLPESVQPAGAETTTSAPLVDPIDAAYSGGMGREWTRVTSDLFSLAQVAEAGDTVRTAKGTTVLGKLEVSGQEIDVYTHLASLVGEGGPFQLKKSESAGRITHDQVFGASYSSLLSLVDYDWQRGDRLQIGDTTLNVLAPNRTTHTLLVSPIQDPGETQLAQPFLLNTLALGHDLPAGTEIKTLRWDPSTVVKHPPATKTGLDAVASAAVKADLIEPIQTADSLTKKPGKSMVIGDGTEATTGVDLVSKVDGQTYTFVKPKGPYAVVTDAEGKTKLKKASTLTQPGAAPVSTGKTEAATTADGSVPALGMTVEAKDGKSGEIVMISPDGKFVFFMWEGKKVRKSTGAVTALTLQKPEPVTPLVKPGESSAPQGFPDVSYGTWESEIPYQTVFQKASDLNPESLVWVQHADGSLAIEPWLNQPSDSLVKNESGSVGAFALNGIGPEGSGLGGGSHVTTASKVGALRDDMNSYKVIVGGKTLLVSPEAMAWAKSEQEVLGTDGTATYSFSASHPIMVSGSPDVTSYTSGPTHYIPAYVPDTSDVESHSIDELLNLGQLSPGDEISVDGVNWSPVVHTAAYGVTIKDSDGDEQPLYAYATGKFFVKHAPAPELGPEADLEIGSTGAHGGDITEAGSVSSAKWVFTSQDENAEAVLLSNLVAYGISGEAKIPWDSHVEVSLETSGALSQEKFMYFMFDSKGEYSGKVILDSGLTGDIISVDDNGILTISLPQGGTSVIDLNMNPDALVEYFPALSGDTKTVAPPVQTVPDPKPADNAISKIHSKIISTTPTPIYEYNGQFIRVGPTGLTTILDLETQQFNPVSDNWWEDQGFPDLGDPVIPAATADAKVDLSATKAKYGMDAPNVYSVGPKDSVLVVKYGGEHHVAVKPIGHPYAYVYVYVNGKVKTADSFSYEVVEEIHNPWVVDLSEPEAAPEIDTKPTVLTPDGTKVDIGPTNAVIKGESISGNTVYIVQDGEGGPGKYYGSAGVFDIPWDEESWNDTLSFFTSHSVIYTGPEWSATADSDGFAGTPYSVGAEKTFWVAGTYEVPAGASIYEVSTTGDPFVLFKAPNADVWTAVSANGTHLGVLNPELADLKEVKHLHGPDIGLELGDTEAPAVSPAANPPLEAVSFSPGSVIYTAEGEVVPDKIAKTISDATAEAPIPPGTDVYFSPVLGWLHYSKPVTVGGNEYNYYTDEGVWASAPAVPDPADNSLWKQVSLKKNAGSPPPAKAAPSAPPGYTTSGLVSHSGKVAAGQVVYQPETGTWYKAADGYAMSSSAWFSPTEVWTNNGWQPIGEEAQYVSELKIQNDATDAPPAWGTPPPPTAVPEWHGSVLKTGHVPAVGMEVSGKGPMTGKIVSISKDGHKATVLTDAGKKSTRLISALSFYKDVKPTILGAVADVHVPGKSVAGTSPAEAISSVLSSDSFTGQGIFIPHDGVKYHAAHAFNAVGPSGKKYARVSFSLTKQQQDALWKALSSGPKTADAVKLGNWDVPESKPLSEIVAGDLVSLRYSNSKGKWIPNKMAGDEPTHKIIAVTSSDGQIELMFEPVTGGPKVVETMPLATTTGSPYQVHTYTWDENLPAKVQPKPKGQSLVISDHAKSLGWKPVDSGSDYVFSALSDSDSLGGIPKLAVEPGQPVPSMHNALYKHKEGNPGLNAVRATLADGTVIEVTNLSSKPGPNGVVPNSSGVVMVSIPESGGNEVKSYGNALNALGMQHEEVTQQSVKDHALVMLRTLVKEDYKDTTTLKGMSEAAIFKKASEALGIDDLGWQDVLVGGTGTDGKLELFWSERVRKVLTAGNNWNVVQRGGKTSTADRIVSVVKFGSLSTLTRFTSGAGAGGISVPDDNLFGNSDGTYTSGGKVKYLSMSNKLGMSGGGMMVVHHPEAVFGRIAPMNGVHGQKDNYGKGVLGDNVLSSLMTTQMKNHSSDLYLPGGLGTQAIAAIGVSNEHERQKAIDHLKSEGITHLNGRPLEQVILLSSEFTKTTPADLPPWEPPAGLIPVTELPTTVVPAVSTEGI